MIIYLTLRSNAFCTCAATWCHVLWQWNNQFEFIPWSKETTKVHKVLKLASDPCWKFSVVGIWSKLTWREMLSLSSDIWQPPGILILLFKSDSEAGLKIVWWDLNQRKNQPWKHCHSTQVFSLHLRSNSNKKTKQNNRLVSMYFEWDQI